MSKQSTMISAVEGWQSTQGLPLQTIVSSYWLGEGRPALLRCVDSRDSGPVWWFSISVSLQSGLVRSSPHLVPTSSRARLVWLVMVRQPNLSGEDDRGDIIFPAAILSAGGLVSSFLERLNKCCSAMLAHAAVLMCPSQRSSSHQKIRQPERVHLKEVLFEHIAACQPDPLTVRVPRTRRQIRRGAFLLVLIP